MLNMFGIGVLQGAINQQQQAVSKYKYEKEAIMRMSEEEFLRKNNPTVKDAWEKYQIALKLAKKN